MMIELFEPRKLSYAVAVLFALLVLAVFSCYPADQNTSQASQQFVERLIEEYEKINDFQATITTPLTETLVEISLQAVTGEKRVIRVTYLAPSEMKGQMFVLKDETLYQYMPAANYIIKTDLKKANLPLSLETFQLTPASIVSLLKSDDLQLELLGTPKEPFSPDTRTESQGSSKEFVDTSGDSCSAKEGGELDCESMSGSFLCSSCRQDYVLEVVPQDENYGFERELIWFDGTTLLPFCFVTYSPGSSEDVVTVLLKDVEINQQLNGEEIGQLPQNAEIIEG